jgi:hypothetical protein
MNHHIYYLEKKQEGNTDYNKKVFITYLNYNRINLMK